MSVWSRLKRWFLGDPPLAFGDSTLDLPSPPDPERATFVPGRRKFLVLAGIAAVGTQIPGWVSATPDVGLSKEFIEQFELDEATGLYRLDLLVGAAQLHPRYACRIVG